MYYQTVDQNDNKITDPEGIKDYPMKNLVTDGLFTVSSLKGDIKLVRAGSPSPGNFYAQFRHDVDPSVSITPNKEIKCVAEEI